MFHELPPSATSFPIDGKFNNPFHYTPHPLCVMASEEVQAYLKSRDDWKEELQGGKMFGVLLVRTMDGKTGYLAAFSGLLGGTYLHEFFVPPVYNLQSPGGFFKSEESHISEINHRIESMETSGEYIECATRLRELKQEAETSIRCYKNEMKASKLRRDELRRSSSMDAETLALLTKESQYQKAELKRKETEWRNRISSLQALLDTYNLQIEDLKKERKARSYDLQMRLFEQFNMLNALGETKNLCEIFASTSQRIPPAGAGECAAPKLLQYAYRHNMHPLAMAEFWWGDSPKSVIRHQGYYYPSCKSKCEPILGFMLQGLEVEAIPSSPTLHDADSLDIVYEDNSLLVINKPSGMLSVPGKSKCKSVYDVVKERYPHADGPLLVHRLDMDTSGLLLIAKNKEVHALLQAQFEERKIKKKYIALLSDKWKKDKPLEGLIKLSIRPDYEDRPKQMVDNKTGKISITRYEVLSIEKHKSPEGVQIDCTRIAFYPLTGRTHQLRVHSAHVLGLDMPIIGDKLYGKPDKRLYLHAQYLEFRHPMTNELIRLNIPSPF